MSARPDSAGLISQLDQVMLQVPNTYAARQALRNHVASLLRVCPTLAPQTNTFAGSGRTVTLFYLYGVLPITYSGTTYNIPVTIYFDPPYPRQPPRCFVTPTAEMAIRQGHQHVDQGGMVYLPYLSSWGEHSTLPELVTIMTSVFCERPPVYSTAATAAQPKAQPVRPVASTPSTAVPVAAAVPAIPVVQATPVVARAVPAAELAAEPPRDVPVSAKDRTVQSLQQQIEERWPTLLEPLVREANEQQHEQRQLEQAASALGGEIEALRRATARSEERAQQLRAMKGQLMGAIGELSARPEEPESLRETESWEGQQVLDLLSEELALEDYLLALDELLESRRITLELFIRETRDASRRQFLCRAQREKAERALAPAPEAQAPAPAARPAPHPPAPAALPVVAAVPVAAQVQPGAAARPRQAMAA